MAREIIALACLVAIGFGGCVVDDAERVGACSNGSPDVGDLALEVTGTNLEEQGYRWSEAVRTVSLEPVQGGEYPANTKRDAERAGAEASIPAGDCVLFGELSPGWYEVDTMGSRESGGDCGWYDADPKHIMLSGDVVNQYSVHSSLACP